MELANRKLDSLVLLLHSLSELEQRSLQERVARELIPGVTVLVTGFEGCAQKVCISVGLYGAEGSHDEFLSISTPVVMASEQSLSWAPKPCFQKLAFEPGPL
jgi:hypothetical protein